MIYLCGNCRDTSLKRRKTQIVLEENDDNITALVENPVRFIMVHLGKITCASPLSTGDPAIQPRVHPLDTTDSELIEVHIQKAVATHKYIILFCLFFY